MNAPHGLCNLSYSIPREIPVIFHNGSNYDYHFIIKEAAEEYAGQFTALGENTEKCIIFSVPINGNSKKLVEREKKLEVKTISYKLKFSEGPGFMASSPPNLVDNLAEVIHKIKCKCGIDNKKCETCGIKYKDCECYLEYTNVKDDLIVYKFLCCSRKIQGSDFLLHTDFARAVSVNLF